MYHIFSAQVLQAFCRCFRFSSLAKLYQNIGFHRKCAFFLRVSAMRCVAPQNQHPDWGLCYQLLLKTTSGYQIDLNNTFVVPKQTGWPTIQIQVLQELVSWLLWSNRNCLNWYAIEKILLHCLLTRNVTRFGTQMVRNRKYTSELPFDTQCDKIWRSFPQFDKISNVPGNF